MKILILGASGFLGGKILKNIKSHLGFNVLGTSYQSTNNEELTKFDVTNEEETASILKEFKPDAVIWSLMSNKSEKYLIEMGLNNIFKYLSSKQKLIFISTNAVFGGNSGKGYYSEEDEPKYQNSNDSLALYANAKIDGERIVKQHENSIIIRPGAIYGQDVNGKWDKRISDLIDKLGCGEEVIRTKNLYNTFVKVDELASAILELIKMDYKGVIHLGPEQKESYFDYYMKMSKNLGLDMNLIKSNMLSEERDVSLDTSKCRKVLGDKFSNP